MCVIYSIYLPLRDIFRYLLSGKKLTMVSPSPVWGHKRDILVHLNLNLRVDFLSKIILFDSKRTYILKIASYLEISRGFYKE